AHGERFIINGGTVTWRRFIEPLISRLAVNVPSYSLAQFKRLPRYGYPFRLAEFISAALLAPEVRSVAKRSPAVGRRFKLRQQLRAEPSNGTRFPATVSSDPRSGPEIWPSECLGTLFSPTRPVFSAEKAHRVFNWRPRIGLGEAQAATIH